MTDTDESIATPKQSLRTVLVAVIAIAALVIAAGGGWFLRGSDEPATKAATPSAVDVGFAQDMITHHVQAVTMAGIERDGTTNSALRSLSFDIETSQQFQVGQMAGWLDVWNKGRENPHEMAWMGHDHMAVVGGLMPGMATAAQLDALTNATGTKQDILFLQLMIHHHQGGLPMARYALDNASASYVRDMAQAMINSQSTEIVEMEQQLRALGGSPLPPPAQ